ncbi:hypothetical protein GCM10009759_77780 [Kitasatospora saccharophila]|uniref:Uncharacterized protein n=1 Tax=Kitasatospora saccharophila TaxID=407973 RepID=A0ABN2YDU1_9ACTN
MSETEQSSEATGASCPEPPRTAGRQYLTPAAKLTIRVYRVRPDGSRVQVSSCASDEDLHLPLVSALTWPRCACPRCVVADVA